MGVVLITNYYVFKINFIKYTKVDPGVCAVSC